MSSGMMIIRGNFAEGNFGDDALLVAVQGLLAQHYKPEEVCFECGARIYRLGVQGYDRLAQGHEMGGAAAILYGGGTQFFAFGPGNEAETSFCARVAHLIVHPGRLLGYLRFWHRFGQAAEVPVMGVGLGFGPFVDNPAEEAKARQLARSMKFIWVRDGYAAKFARDSGCSAVVDGADLCFMRGFREVHVRHSVLATDCRRVGIVLRDWQHGKEAMLPIENWLEVARRCREAGFEVAFYAFSLDSDAVVIKELECADEEVCAWNPERMLVAEFSAELDRCQVLVTCRYHAAVFALLLGKPFIAVGIEPKLRMVAELLGGSGYLVEPDETPEHVADCIGRVMDGLADSCARAVRVRDEQSDLADAAMKQFHKALHYVSEVK